MQIEKTQRLDEMVSCGSFVNLVGKASECPRRSCDWSRKVLIGGVSLSFVYFGGSGTKPENINLHVSKINCL